MTKAFQSFEDVSDSKLCAPRVSALRAELARRGADGFLVPRADEHQGEYVPKRAERLAWLTAFTGSAGLAIVLKDKAALFVDGRYTLQAADQTDTALFEVKDHDAPFSWLEENLRAGMTLGYDPLLHTQAAVERYRAVTARLGAKLLPFSENPLDAVWSEQPAPPLAAAVPHPVMLAGETSQSKRKRIAQDLESRKIETAVLTLPDSICWLLNMRGSDVPHTPFVLCFALLNADGTVDLFIDARKVSAELRAHFGEGVNVRPSSDFLPALDALGKKRVLIDPNWASSALFDRLAAASAEIVRGLDPCQLPKSCKNAVELEGARRAHIRDGQALSRFLAWFAREAPKGGLSEISAAKKLEALRAETGALKDLSFDSIAGAGAHGAIVHYRVTEKTNREIANGELFLIDSGAQYEDGTTDVTRTIAVGRPTAEMRDRFTRVLKGHIQLATARFPEGTVGAQLDGFARRALWEAGLDYGHGTGHGVGVYLSVHEGPQGISPRSTVQPLKTGMICSNEPGYYKSGEYGIRIENLVVVREAEKPEGAEKPMLSFETITLAPIDLALVEASLLTGEERAWLNAYHAAVRNAVSPAFAGDKDGSAWLESATRAI